MMSPHLHKILKTCFLILSFSLLISCATVPGGEPAEGDPFESYNRAMFSFNDGLDQYILKPVAEGYDSVVPDPIKTGVTNFFSNIGDIFVIINDILQFKFSQAVEDTSRFIFNTTFGVFGIFDVATPMGLPKHNEDFGQTFATWGIGEGPYIVLPFFGPKTLRGTAGFAVEITYDPVYHIENEDTLYATVALSAVDVRYRLLKAGRIVDQAALDKYSFVRDAYLQNRRNLVHDGNPPLEELTPAPESTADDLELEKELGL